MSVLQALWAMKASDNGSTILTTKALKIILSIRIPSERYPHYFLAFLKI